MHQIFCWLVISFRILKIDFSYCFKCLATFYSAVQRNFCVFVRVFMSKSMYVLKHRFRHRDYFRNSQQRSKCFGKYESLVKEIWKYNQLNHTIQISSVSSLENMKYLGRTVTLTYFDLSGSWLICNSYHLNQKPLNFLESDVFIKIRKEQSLVVGKSGPIMHHSPIKYFAGW